MRVFGRHPDEQTLSLFAGGDLGALARRFVSRHVNRCEECRTAVASYSRVRTEIAGHSAVPDVDFAALAHNARVALEQQRSEIRVVDRWRWKAAVGGLAATCLVAVAFIPMERGESPAPPVATGQLDPDLTRLPTAFDGLAAQITSEGHLAVRAFHQGSGTMTITEYYAP